MGGTCRHLQNVQDDASVAAEKGSGRGRPRADQARASAVVGRSGGTGRRQEHGGVAQACTVGESSQDVVQSMSLRGWRVGEGGGTVTEQGYFVAERL